MVGGLKMYVIFLLGQFTHCIHRNRNFDVIWNVPSEVCKIKYDIELPLSKFGIRFNKNETFSGDIIKLFYEPTPGLYPRYLLNGMPQNGGLPQLVNHTGHMVKAKLDILKSIPDDEFRGLAVIDWESWVPTFDRNMYDNRQRVYIKSSELLVEKQHPDWNFTRIEDEARIQFQSAARQLMEETLILAKALRPSGYWGYYGFPKCYNYRTGQRNCTRDTMEYNNDLCWMFSTSSSLFPSIYLKESFGSIEDRRIKVEGIIREAKRMKNRCAGPTIPILAYSRYRYSDTEKFYIKEDVLNTIQQSYNEGLDGVILWDSYDNFTNKTDCVNTVQYLTTLLGPIVKNLTMK